MNSNIPITLGPTNFEEKLVIYLNAFAKEKNPIHPRVQCCGKSRGFFCEQCQQLLIPSDQWPETILNGNLNLPFDLDIILSDRKRSSSGLHAVVLLKASEDCRNEQKLKEETVQQGYVEGKEYHSTMLYDTNDGDEIPSYHQDDDTFFLFPSKDSVPLSSVASKIKRLIVLDCKWTKTVTQNLPQLQTIQHVHLDGQFVPKESHYWRWHNAGQGMCSTVEAIYFAALQVATEKKLCNQEVDNLIHIMWLFAIQRASTIETAKREGKPDPFSLEGKERQRNLRRTIKGSEKHLKDIENGKRLKKIHHESKKAAKKQDEKI